MIYFIQAETGEIKIGVSNDPIGRLNALSAGSPHPLTLIAVSEGGYGEESELHHHFDYARKRLEWFWPVKELLKLVSQLADENGFEKVESGDELYKLTVVSKKYITEHLEENLPESKLRKRRNREKITIPTSEELAQELATWPRSKPAIQMAVRFQQLGPWPENLGRQPAWFGHMTLDGYIPDDSTIGHIDTDLDFEDLDFDFEEADFSELM